MFSGGAQRFSGRSFSGHWLILSLCALFSLGVYTYALNNDYQDFGDSAQYMLLAKSLATGQGYRTVNYPDKPLHTDYPPLFPMLLAPLVALVGLKAFVLKGLGIGVVWGLFVGAWLWFSRTLSSPAALCALGMVMVSPQLLISAHSIQPEPVFACLLVLVFVLLQRGSTPLWLVGVLCGLAYLTRRVGLLLVPAILIQVYFETGTLCSRARRASQVLLGFIAVALPWWLFEYLAHDPISHVALFDLPTKTSWGQSLSQAARRMSLNAASLSQQIWPLLIETWMKYRLATLVPLGLLAFGGYRAWKEGQRALVSFLLLYVGLFAFWPWTTQRFFIPLIPLLALLTVWALARHRTALGVFASLVAMQAVLTLLLSQEIRHHTRSAKGYGNGYVQGLLASGPLMAPGVMVAAPEERLLSLLLDRQAVGYWFNLHDWASLQAFLKHYRLHYLVYDAGVLRGQRLSEVESPALLHPPCFESVYVSHEFELLAVKEACR